mmetsp:Transcript_8301/g.10507  ORF Transcript_8301/g.10507 Transcript_8301/m.10507 type:complete len:80 (+) Transcript_8301:280-519(+)
MGISMSSTFSEAAFTADVGRLFNLLPILRPIEVVITFRMPRKLRAGDCSPLSDLENMEDLFWVGEDALDELEVEDSLLE